MYVKCPRITPAAELERRSVDAATGSRSGGGHLVQPAPALLLMRHALHLACVGNARSSAFIVEGAWSACCDPYG
jgi:hypothetical protein